MLKLSILSAHFAFLSKSGAIRLKLEKDGILLRVLSQVAPGFSPRRGRLLPDFCKAALWQYMLPK